MTAEEFVILYEEALSTQQWAAVEPLIHDACVPFSTGTVHKRKQSVRAAFERNFSARLSSREQRAFGTATGMNMDKGIRGRISNLPTTRAAQELQP